MTKNASTMIKNQFNYYSSVPWGLSDVVSSYALIFLLAVLCFSFIITLNQPTGMLTFAIVQITLSLGTLGIVYLFITKKYHLNFLESLGINSKDLSKYLSQGFLTSLFILSGTTIITYMFTSFAGVPEESPYSNVSVQRLQIISLFAIFFAPIVEEVFFRGFMQPAMCKHIGPIGGIVITSLIFGLSHTQYFGSYIALISVIFIGGALGTARHITGSVMPGIFAHLINNLIAAIAILSLH